MKITIDNNSNFEHKGGGKIEINARYYLTPAKGWFDPCTFDVIDRARELQFLPAVIFSNGNEKECREWVERNCDEPGGHTRAPWGLRPTGMLATGDTGNTRFIAMMHCHGPNDTPDSEDKANAALLLTSPKLLALLEQYHMSFPTKESGRLICESRGWLIQE